MKILTCLKQILDPDVPAADFAVDRHGKRAVPGSANLVPNIFCENAIETALKLRQSSGGEITVLCYGSAEGEKALRKALAMTVDHAVLVLREGASDPDPWTVAKVLAAAIGKLGQFDLILLGRESGDWGVGQTGGLLAEELGLPSLSLVDRIEATEAPEGAEVELRRQTDSGFEVARARVPLVLTITNDETNLPRIPKTRDIMRSVRKQLTQWTLADLGLDSEEIKAGDSHYRVVDLFQPEKEVHCELVEGESLEEKVEQFAQRVARVLDSPS